MKEIGGGDRGRFAQIAAALFFSGIAQAAPDRITVRIDDSRTERLAYSLHPQARPEYDRGPAEGGFSIAYATLLIQPSAAQQRELDRLLADQQDRRTPDFHRWLSPEQFADPFGLSRGDAAKVSDWLRAQGLVVNDVARGRHWITFSGTAATVGAAFHTEIHRYLVGGEMHFANATPLAIPSALRGIVGGVDGLHDFRARHSGRAAPQFTSGTGHALAPDDLATIYDIGPLYQMGIDGSGQRVVVVGGSNIQLSDTRGFQQEFGLPVRDPQVILYGPDPGINGDLGEGEGDVEVVVSVARNATVLYVYANDVNNAVFYAIDQNLAPVMTESYITCEAFESPAFRVVGQQANAQGITWLAAAGDAGPANCDAWFDASHPMATNGYAVGLPASLPEVTAVGGTEFNEGSGTYWRNTNSATGESALSYIPEMAWDDTGAFGLEAGAGGPSALFDKPGWQSGPGVPGDGARDVPDVAFTASTVHDSYEAFSKGSAGGGSGGTSAASPLFAGIVTLLNQYLSVQGAAPGLGNINPGIYRMAQSTTDVFHDVTAGNTNVPCVLGTLDCTSGTIGYSAGPGYDLATGWGSVDAYHFVMEWSVPAPSATALSANATDFNAPGTLLLTAAVSGPGGTPTGSVVFLSNSALGTVSLNADGVATLAVADYRLPTGASLVTAIYSGDANYGSSTASLTVNVTLPASGSAVAPAIAPNPVLPLTGADGQPEWNIAITLRNLTAAGTTLTGFTIDGADYSQQISSVFGSPSLAGNGSLSGLMSFQNLSMNSRKTAAARSVPCAVWCRAAAFALLSVPSNRVFAFSGADANGQKWTVQAAAAFSSVAPSTDLVLVAEPPVAVQNPAADPACQWAQQLTLESYTPTALVFGQFTARGDDGSFDDLSGRIQEIFGTTRMVGYGVMQGTVCWGGSTPPAPKQYALRATNYSGILAAEATVRASFAPPPAGANVFSVSPSSLVFNLQSSSSGVFGTATMQVSCGGSPNWSVAQHYADGNEASWISVLTQPGATTVLVSMKQPQAGVYSATLSFQCADGLPQAIDVPVVLAVGASDSVQITGVGNGASFGSTVAPGTLMSVFGSGLAAQTAAAASTPLPLSLLGVSATINELDAPLYFVSPNQLNIQVPYVTGGGTAVLGVNNNGKLASYLFQVAPAAPGIFTDAGGNLAPQATAAPGQTITLFMTGDGDERPLLTLGSPSDGSEHPILPVTVTVAGLPAAITYAGLPAGLVGVTQVNFTVPAGAPSGEQPVIVTVGGVASKAATLSVAQ